MGSLKEIKERIASVGSTMKITGAMKMIASVKLHRAQTMVEQIRPYGEQLEGMLSRLAGLGEDIDSPFVRSGKNGKTAWVVCASNTGLCGAFNANVEKEFLQRAAGFPPGGLSVFPVGKKIREFLVKNGFSPEGDFDALSDKPAYQAAASLADDLMRRYAAGEFREVYVLYHHFHNRMVQTLAADRFLPFAAGTFPDGGDPVSADYILEPSAQELTVRLFPQALRLKLYTCLLDNSASEHGARTMAMQQATDNAADLLQQLTLQYNKSRQQTITNELLDIAGGSAG